MHHRFTTQHSIIVSPHKRKTVSVRDKWVTLFVAIYCKYKKKFRPEYEILILMPITLWKVFVVC